MSTALQSIQDQIKKDLENTRKSVPAPSGRNISVKGKVFTLPDGRSSQGPIQAVILDHRNFNRYYTEAYNPQESKPPGCFALSKELPGMAPHAEAKDPQADSCEACPMNKWGSAPNGGKGKACRNTVRLAIAPTDAKDDEDPMILTVSPTGLKSWASLANGLETAGLIPVQVVTEIKFDDNAAYPTLQFRAMEPHESLEKFWALREKAQALLDQPPASD